MPDTDGLLDTSVVIDLEKLSDVDLPINGSISAVTLAELAIGPLHADTVQEQAFRQDRFQRTLSMIPVRPFDAAAAQAYRLVYAQTLATGRHPRRRLADLMIAATALAAKVPLYTRNPGDVAHLDQIIEIKRV